MKLKSVRIAPVAAAALLVFAAACSSTKKTAGTSSGTKTEVAAKHYSAAELEEGKMLWEKSCDRCHKLYLPESRSQEKWDKILPRMVKRSKLNEDEAGKVRGYIMSKAQS
ncbi:MAG TPA: hypothetical protein VL098_00020 [Flavipsychrobacter sp.]|nr:hypothetical protein [Flavipsychrobacter sp.]